MVTMYDGCTYLKKERWLEDKLVPTTIFHGQQRRLGRREDEDVEATIRDGKYSRVMERR
jgi:hypothetical protein